MLTQLGPGEIKVPRFCKGSFEPVIVPMRKRHLDGMDQIVLSPSMRGLATREISAHLAKIYRGQAFEDTIIRIPWKVVGEPAECLRSARSDLSGAFRGRDRRQGPRQSSEQHADLRRHTGNHECGTQNLRHRDRRWLR